MMDTNYLHADFLQDDRVYLGAQRMWATLVEQIAQVHNYTVVPYMNLEQNGTPIRDGNPMLALQVTETGRAIRIIQPPLDEDGDDLGAWLDNFGDEIASGRKAIPELVIDVKLTPLTIAFAAVLISKWFDNALDEKSLTEWLAPWGSEEE
ncbi:MAG: hypothetical protein AAGA31_05345 [Bacteroidota bacterium]